MRVAFSDLAGVPDGLDAQPFWLELGAIPLIGQAENRRLGIKLQTCQWPGTSNEAFEVAAHGHVVKVRGRRVYERTSSSTYFEDSQMRTKKVWETWHEGVVGTESGNSFDYKPGYSVTAKLSKYDTVGKEIDTCFFEGYFPTEISSIDLDGTSSQLVQVNITCSYDRVRFASVTVR